MITLLLDSANKMMAVGIAKDGQLLDYVYEEAWQRQSELMVPAIAKLLQKHKLDRKDIERVFIGVGPGSYTGVRIAVTIAKTIAVALNVPLIPISSLRIYQHLDKPTICIINARSNRSYVGVYERDNVIIADTIMKNADLLAYISSHPTYLLTGETSHLGLEKSETNPLQTMAGLLSMLKPAEQPLSVNPVYMKD